MKHFGIDKMWKLSYWNLWAKLVIPQVKILERKAISKLFAGPDIHVCIWNFSFKSEFFLLINKRILIFCPGPLGPGQKGRILLLMNKKNWLQKMLMYFEFCCFFWFALWYNATSDFKEKLYSPMVKMRLFTKTLQVRTHLLHFSH